MRATFMSRARIALAAAISATILAIGICMASTPATAQAVTVSNGAEMVMLVPDGPKKQFDSSYAWVEVREEPEGYMTNYYLDFIYGGLRFYSDEAYVDTYQDAVKIPCRLIKLKNGCYFFEKVHDSGDDFSPVTIDYSNPISGSGGFNHIYGALGPQYCGIEYGDYGMSSELIKVSGNTMTVRYTHYNSNGIFKKKSSRTVVYDYKYVYDSSKSRMKRDSAIATVAKNTTTWRTLAKSRTAYKSSTSSTKKFTIKKGSVVQVKKVYTYNLKTRYYVKTKSGKYGWISAGCMYYQGA